MRRLMQIFFPMLLAGCAHVGSPPVAITPAQANDAARHVLRSLYLSPAPPVTIRADESWFNERVAGNSGANSISGLFACTRTSCRIELAPNESDLAHELLHWYSYRTTGDANPRHLGWTERGFEDRIYRYQDAIGVPHNRGY